MSIARIARPAIRRLRPYSSAEQADETVRLNANEAPWTNACDHFRRPLNRYPELRSATLSQALAKHFAVQPSQLLVTRGSSEAIDLLIRAFCRPAHDNIVITSPSFSMYAHYALIQDAGVVEVSSDPDNNFEIGADAILASCNQSTRLVFICSPNNPTGTLIKPGNLIRILEERKNKSAVVVDEAYIEFSGQSSSLRMLEHYDNLVVLRTFSKAIAFAGARCGIAFGSADVIDLIGAVQAPYAMATPVIECVQDALQSGALEDANTHIQEIITERERMAEALKNFSFVDRLWPSAANFLFLRFDDAARVLAHVRHDHLLLRDFGKEMSNCVRITIGSRAENDKLLGSLQRLERIGDG